MNVTSVVRFVSFCRATLIDSARLDQRPHTAAVRTWAQSTSTSHSISATERETLCLDHQIRGIYLLLVDEGNLRVVN